ncbi:MAG: hypothetical protein ACK2U9_01435 [Anaerolineae bacterium]
MSASQSKIITKLRERREIEADLRDLLAASSEVEFRRRAQRIASLGAPVIQALVDGLDRADTRMLTVLGTVATFLDREQVTQALRQAALQPGRSDRGRLGALTILEHFLGEPPDDTLLESLHDPEGVALASLEEVLVQADANSATLVEYVQGLDRQEPDVVLAVVRALRDIGEPGIVEPLRMMAQDVRGEIAAAAVDVLAGLRLPEAARALQSLVPIVHPELREPAERALRKLRFAGVEVRDLPDPDPAWRALVSPVDGLGQQSIWFVQEGRWGAHVRVFNVLLNDRAGAVEAIGHRRVSPRALPPQRLLGYVHDIVLPDGSGVMLALETTFDVGRRLVLDSLAYNRETQIPVAGALRLLSPWLWEVAGAEALPPRVLPDLPEDVEAALAGTDRLLDHPAFASWSARSEATFQAAQEALRHPGWDREVWVRRLAGELLADPLVAEVLGRRLLAMSEWLLLAREETWSRLALVAALVFEGAPLSKHPFVQVLVRRDLDQAVRSLKQQAGPSLGVEQFE